MAFLGGTRVVPVVTTRYINNQSKSGITPSTSLQIIEPDEDYTGLSQVTVNAIPASYIIPSGIYTVTNSGTYNISTYASVSTPAMANPTWTAATLNSSQAKVTYSITLNSGFKSNNQTFSSSYVLPSVAGATITPGDTSQTAIDAYKWTLGSVIVASIPSTISLYKKIYEKTINDTELNTVLSTMTSIQPAYIFGFQNNLSSTIIGSVINSMASSAFISCNNLLAVSFPLISGVASNAFYYCRKLVSAYFASATTFFNSCFYYCGLTTISAPNLSMIYTGALAYNKFTTVNFPKLTSINGGAFSYCYNLQSVSFSLLTKIVGGYGFYQCSALSSVNLPLVESIDNYTFGNCNSLINITLPVCSLVNACAFEGCKNLKMISLPKLTVLFSQFHFRYCYNLISLYLMNSVVATLSNSNAFTSTPIGGYSTSAGTFGSIYVPASLLASYQAATNWSFYSSRFVGV